MEGESRKCRAHNWQLEKLEIKEVIIIYIEEYKCLNCDEFLMKENRKVVSAFDLEKVWEIPEEG